MIVLSSIDTLSNARGNHAGAGGVPARHRCIFAVQAKHTIEATCDPCVMRESRNSGEQVYRDPPVSDTRLNSPNSGSLRLTGRCCPSSVKFASPKAYVD